MTTIKAAVITDREMARARALKDGHVSVAQWVGFWNGIREVRAEQQERLAQRIKGMGLVAVEVPTVTTAAVASDVGGWVVRSTWRVREGVIVPFHGPDPRVPSHASGHVWTYGREVLRRGGVSLTKRSGVSLIHPDRWPTVLGPATGPKVTKDLTVAALIDRLL